MNIPAQIKHEDWMTDEDISYYDQMLSMGRLQIGKEIGHNEEYLLHIASMITLKKMKGMLVDLSDPQIIELKRIHEEHQKAGLIFETPPDSFYESARVLREPYLDPEVEKEISKANANLIIDKSTSNIADEPVDVIDEIKEGYVKIVPTAEP